MHELWQSDVFLSSLAHRLFCSGLYVSLRLTVLYYILNCFTLDIPCPPRGPGGTAHIDAGCQREASNTWANPMAWACTSHWEC